VTLEVLAPFDADFDEDGDVDGDDLAEWRAGFGEQGTAVHTDGDANGDHDVDGADFLTWQRQLGSTSSVASSLAVPEPDATLLILLVAMLAREAPGSNGFRRRCIGSKESRRR
jgi:hypothetical protein